MASSIRFAAPLRELRIHLCQTSAASNGVRQFIKAHYVPLKTANPKFPILVRECSGVAPKLWARYDFGKEVVVPLEGKSDSDVLGVVKDLSTGR